MNPYILVFGSGRSGTTFLAKLLDSHPDVLYRHEPDSVNINTDIPFLPDREDLQSYIPQAQRYVASLAQTRHIRVVSQLPIFAKSYRTRPQQIAYRYAIHAAKAMNGLPIHVAKGRIWIPDLISPEYSKNVIYVIKSVNSLCRARLFSLSIPSMKVVHIIRNPCAVIASRLRGIEKGKMTKETYIKSMFAMKSAPSYGYSIESILSRSLEEQMAFQWMVQNQLVFDDMKTTKRYFLARYEEFCNCFSSNTAILFNMLNIDVTHQTETYIRRIESSDKYPRRYFSIIRPLRSALNKWRNELSNKQIKNIKDIVLNSEVGQMYAEDMSK